MYNCCSVYNPPGGAAGAVTGSGTLNYVSKWTPDGSTLGNSQIFDNGTNVGVGTNIPSSYFDIIKAQNAATIVSISNSNAGNASRAGYYAASEDNNLSFQVYSSTLTNTYLRNNAVLYGGKRALRIIADADGAGSGTITFGIGSGTATGEFATVDASGNWNFYSPAGSPSLTARIGVTGSGTTSATYTAIFQNGAATPLKSLQIRDDGLVSVSTSAQNTYPVADKLNVYGIIRAFGDTTYDQAAIVLNTNGGGFGRGWSIESNLAASGNLWFKQAPNSAADPVATGVTMASFNSAGRFTLSTNIAPATTARLSLYETNYANTSQSQTLVGFTTDAEGINVGASMGLGGITNAAYTVFGSVGGRKENATAGSSLGYLQFSTYGSGGLSEGMRLNSSQYLIQKANNAAIADGDLSNSQMSWYIDESGNNIIVKVKYSGGTVKTATMALV